MLSSGPSFLRTIRCAAYGLLSVVASAFVSGQTPDVAGTLPEDLLPGLKPILAQAMKQSPKMLLQQIEIAREEAQLIEARAERLPQIGGNIRYDSNRTAASASIPSTDSGLFYSLNANQAVFHWGALKHRTDAAKIEVAISGKNYAEAYRSLAVEIRQVYLELVAQNAKLRSERFDLSLKQADLVTAKERLALGSTTAGDIAGRELDINETQLAIDRDETEFDANRRRLSRLAGISPVIPADQIPSEIPAPKFDAATSAQLLAALLRDGAKSSFKSQIADLHIKEADLNYRIARVRHLPMFNAGLAHSRESSTSATATQVSQTAITRDSIEVRGDWNIFDGFATKGYKLEALAEKHSWQRQREIDAEAIMDEAQRLQRIVGIDARALEYANQRHAGVVAQVQIAEDDLKKAGTASQSTVNAAKRNLYLADWNAALTRATFLSDWSSFVSLVAEDPALMNLPSRYVRATR